jgi:acetyl esterase/lipase
VSGDVYRVARSHPIGAEGGERSVVDQKVHVHEVEITRGVEYARTDSGPLALDLYRPAGAQAPVTVLYMHGGGFAVGDRAAYAAERLTPIAERGVAVASASYRFSDVATYPSQVHDVKGAVRWLRAHGGELGLATERLGAWGASAGGYLALMLGLTAGNAELEGDVGGNLDQDSSVQAVCDWFAPVDFAAAHVDNGFPLPAFAAGPPPDPPYPARLLGLRRVEDDLDAARAASPINMLDGAAGGAESYLFVHGDRDGLVHDSASRAMHEALLAHGIDSSLILLGGANHEGPEFDRPEVLSAVAGFFLDAL